MYLWEKFKSWGAEFCRKKINWLSWVGIEKGKIPQSSAQEVRFTAKAAEQVSVNGYCATHGLDFHYKFAHDVKKLTEI